jgi:hypothetical protein
MREKWRNIKDFPHYQVSNFGNVHSLLSNKILSKVLRDKRKKGKCYYMVAIYNEEGIRKNLQVHRLVAEAFIRNPTKLPVVNHKYLNKLNNNVENLEWCTVEHNNRHWHAAQRKTVPYMGITVNPKTNQLAFL